MLIVSIFVNACILYLLCVKSWFLNTKWIWSQSQSQNYITADSQSASLSWCQAPIWDLRLDIFSDTCGFFMPLWQEDGYVFYNVQYIYILHVITWMYTQYIQGFCQSRLSMADRALTLVNFHLRILAVILLIYGLSNTMILFFLGHDTA
jgi:hypothetical protein